METETKKPRKKKATAKEEIKKAEIAGAGILIAVIRIAGEVKMKKEITNTLYRLRLRKKYACTLVNRNNQGMMGMLEKVKHHVAYGEIDEKTLEDLIRARGKSIEGDNIKLKIKSEEAAKELIHGKKSEEIGLKGFFRLHPPRKGIKSKQIYPKGVLGNHKENINKLIERML